MKGEFSIEKIVSILLILIVLILLIVGINAIKDKIYKSTEDIFSNETNKDSEATSYLPNHQEFKSLSGIKKSIETFK